MIISKLHESDYPKLLRSVTKKPPYLYHAGTPIPSDDHKFLCVVGSRKHSEYGKEACIKLISGLKNYPVVIVSGLALGIDSLAHEVALQNGMKTIAIPGSGLSDEVLYPPSHYRLAMKILKSGNTLLSPFDSTQYGDKWTFPVRNQLMAAISDATLVIEGGEKSGTLITARYTLELDREVMIVPGSIFSDLSYGPHKLYFEGARPVMRSEDILDVLGFDIRDRRTDRIASTLNEAIKSLPPDQSRVLELLQYKPCTSTELIEKTGLSTSEFSIAATKLELYGIIKQVGGYYQISPA